ncbi:MAG TPA: DUF5752 family protein [bacterium]|jgi:hypothetical protein
MPKPFIIKDCAQLAIATGIRANNLPELGERVASSDLDCVYYHFWGGLLRPRFDDPDFRNDFAAWAFHSMNDPVLAERLSIIIPTQHKDFSELRNILVEVIEDRLEEDDKVYLRHAHHPFHFIKSRMVVFDTGIRVKNPEEFIDIIPGLDIGSLFYHFIDSRRRLNDEHDDFSEWMDSFKKDYSAIINDLRTVDPYLNTIPELKDLVHGIFCEHLHRSEIT